MTGVGAIFELWSEWQDSKKPKEETEEDVQLEPDPDEVEEGYLDENSDWHKAIQNQNWDSLLFMLQQFDFAKYRSKPKEKKKRRLRVVKAADWVKEKVKKPEEEEPIPVSPLLALNELGQTPLHAAIANLAPDRLIVRLANSERRAALIADKNGHIPLHLSTIHERNTQVIDRCIRSNFHHMQQLDEDDRTAMWYAVERAVIRTEENLIDLDLYWGIPRDQEDMEWQERQEVFWEKVKFILLSYSSRRKVMISEERLVLLESLEHAAPPTVVELCIMACQGMLHTDPSLASSALKIFMRRSYPIKNLQLLLYHFPVKREESLHAARRILTDHYHLGCRTLEGRDVSFREEMEKHALEPKFKRSLHTQEWWNKIKCLLRLCGHGNDKDHKKEFADKHLLQAALSNFDTPPSLVQLLMAMNPEAIKMRHPFLNCLLIHLICRNWKYNLYPHSKSVGVNLEMAEPPMEQVLKIIITSDPSTVRKRHDNRLPLHHAVATGKSIEFLDALIKKDRDTLGARDPGAKLFPYQMAALPSLNRNSALWAVAKYGEEEWKSLRSKKRAAAVEEVLNEQDLEQLSTIYTLIREYPSALKPPTLVQKPAGIGKKRGCGMISTHFLKLLYQRQPRDGDSVVDESAELDPEKDEWTFLKYNMTFFLLALENRVIPSEIDQWWDKMKFWIRFSYTGDTILPPDDEYLLHAAVSNPDTPPLMVELLLAIYPESASLPVEGNLEYPLHIAAATPTYVPQYFENYETKNVYQLLIDAYPEASSVKTSSGIPLDIARSVGKADDETGPLLKASLRPGRSSRRLQRERSSRSAGRSLIKEKSARGSSLKREKSSRSGRSSLPKENSLSGRRSRSDEQPPVAAVTTFAAGTFESVGAADNQSGLKPEITTHDLLQSSPSPDPVLAATVEKEKDLVAKQGIAREDVDDTSNPNARKGTEKVPAATNAPSPEEPEASIPLSEISVAVEDSIFAAKPEVVTEESGDLSASPTEATDMSSQPPAALLVAIADDTSDPTSEGATDQATHPATQESASPTAQPLGKSPAGGDDDNSVPESQGSIAEGTHPAPSSAQEVVESSEPATTTSPVAVADGEDLKLTPGVAMGGGVESQASVNDKTMEPTPALSEAPPGPMSDNELRSEQDIATVVDSNPPSLAESLPEASERNEPVTNSGGAAEILAVSTPLLSTEKEELMQSLVATPPEAEITEGDDEVLRMTEDVGASLKEPDGANGEKLVAEPSSDGFGDGIPDDDEIMRMMESIQMSEIEPVPYTEQSPTPIYDGMGEDTPDDDEILKMMEEVRLAAEASAPFTEMEPTNIDSGEDEPDDEEIRKMLEEVSAMAEQEIPDGGELPIAAEPLPHTSGDAEMVSHQMVDGTGGGTPADGAIRPSAETAVMPTSSSPKFEGEERDLGISEAKHSEALDSTSKGEPAVVQDDSALPSEAEEAAVSEDATEQNGGLPAVNSIASTKAASPAETTASDGPSEVHPKTASVEKQQTSLSAHDPKEHGSSDENGHSTKTFYSLADLQNNVHPDVDVLRKEAYLAPEEFETQFQMTKEEFDKQPKWKREKAKKAAGIF